MAEYECTNSNCSMVGHIDSSKVCRGCGKPKVKVKNSGN